MSLATKMKVGASTAAVLLAAGVGMTVLEQTRDKDDNYVLSSKWFPGVMPMHSDVHITVTVDGVPVIRRKTRLSPWSETMTASKGAIVKMTATSLHASTELVDCMIMVNGRMVPSTGFDESREPGTAQCQV